MAPAISLCFSLLRAVGGRARRSGADKHRRAQGLVDAVVGDVLTLRYYQQQVGGRALCSARPLCTESHAQGTVSARLLHSFAHLQLAYPFPRSNTTVSSQARRAARSHAALQQDTRTLVEQRLLGLSTDSDPAQRGAFARIMQTWFGDNALVPDGDPHGAAAGVSYWAVAVAAAGVMVVGVRACVAVVREHKLPCVGGDAMCARARAANCPIRIAPAQRSRARRGEGGRRHRCVVVVCALLRCVMSRRGAQIARPRRWTGS